LHKNLLLPSLPTIVKDLMKYGNHVLQGSATVVFNADSQDPFKWQLHCCYVSIWWPSAACRAKSLFRMILQVLTLTSWIESAYGCVIKFVLRC